MKVTQRSGSEARSVLLRMVADTAVVATITPKWDGQLFGSRPENLIAGWAVAHYKKFGKAPGKDIAKYFDRWNETQRDEAVVEFVGRFLESLSKEYTKNGASVSSAMVLDMAARVFDKVRLERMTEEINAAIEKGDLEKAAEIPSKFRRAEVATTSVFHPFKGGAVIRNALRGVGKPLIKWPQEAMNAFFADSLSREEFVVFTGPEKRGKSWWLQEIAFQGLINRRKVAFFEVGDQSQKQLLRRFAARAACRPYKKDKLVRYPISMTPCAEEDSMPNIEFDLRKYDRPMTPKEADDAMIKFGKEYDYRNFRLTVRPNSTINIAGIQAMLEAWQRDNNWIPDIIVIDYIDILAPLEGSAQTRDQINATWMGARRLSQMFHCLLVTATQSNKESYDSDLIDMSNVTEDKRKNGHLTAEIGICQTQPEKEQQLYRLNWPLARDLEYTSTKCVWCASCLACANPCVLACF